VNGYVDAGYIVAIGTLLSYGGTLVARERGARLRLEAGARDGTADATKTARAGEPSGDHNDFIPPK
jgi:hypothetical protein